MFRIISGNPGSGKSFYAVNYLKKFAKYDALYNVMLLDPHVLLVTNLDDVCVQHMLVDDFRSQDLINPDKLKKYMEDHQYKRVVYIHDEASKILGGIRDNREFFFFEYHRHLGMDVFLLVQTISTLPRRLVELAEYVIEAKNRSIGIMGFEYFLRDSKTGQQIGKVVLKRDVNVFRLYKSFNFDEVEKPKKIVMRKFVTGAIVMAVSVFIVFFALKRAFYSQMKPGAAQKVQKQEMVLQKEVKGEKPQEKKPGRQTADPPALEELSGNFYVLLPSQTEIDRRPGGRLKGVSMTDKGTYLMY